MVKVIRRKYIVFWDHIHVFAERVKIFELLGQFIFSDNETDKRGKEYIGSGEIEDWKNRQEDW